MSSLSEKVQPHLKAYQESLQLVRNQLNSYRQQLSQIQGIIRQKEAEEVQVYGQIKALTDLLESEKLDEKPIVSMKPVKNVQEAENDDSIEIEEVN